MTETHCPQTVLVSVMDGLRQGRQDRRHGIHFRDRLPQGFRLRAQMKAETLVMTAASAATIGGSRTSIF